MFHAVEADVLGTLSSFAVAKSISLQLLEKNIGDDVLFHALFGVFTLSTSKDASIEKVETALWNALDLGLDEFAGRGKDHMMIVIDGLNQLKSSNDIQKVSDYLGKFTSKHGRLQAITLTNGISHKPRQGRLQQFQIKPDHTLEDLRHIAEHVFRGYAHYDDQSEHSQEVVVEQLIHAAQGNFLWLLLTIYLLKKETSHESFAKAVKSIKDSPKSLPQTIGLIVQKLDLSGSEAQHFLSWMLYSQRPLTLAEFQCLRRIDLHKRNLIEHKTDIKNDIHAALGPLAIFQNNFVRFRHAAVREYLRDSNPHGMKFLEPRAAQTEFVRRLLAYFTFNITQSQEPSLELIDTAYVDVLFGQHALLEYVVRNWVLHFQASSMYINEKSLQVSDHLKGIFPASPLMAKLEWSCWSLGTFHGVSHDFALRVRESVFTEKHESVIQNLIICGTLARETSQTNEAGAYFYRASRIGRQILSKHSKLITACATMFLTITETITSTTRTELITWKEETLIYVIDVYKHQHGKTHDLTIRYLETLAQLYVEIREEQKAENVWRELREIMTARFGKGSEVCYDPFIRQWVGHKFLFDFILTLSAARE